MGNTGKYFQKFIFFQVGYLLLIEVDPNSKLSLGSTYK